jgi:uncharacterized protein (DUF342 family)/DNA-binding response OmpR family regulator
MKAVLSGNGYRVNGYRLSHEALDDLERSGPSPYSVVISDYMMPKMKGDEILKKVSQISPNTQKILIVDFSDPQSLIHTINFVGIHSCLTIPFNDEDLLSQVNRCCHQYTMFQKQENFKRLTRRQNRQLTQLAVNFQKKSLLYSSRLERKNKEIRLLETRLRFLDLSSHDYKPTLLEDVLAARAVSFSTDALVLEFLAVKDRIKRMLEDMAFPAGIILAPVLYKTVFESTPLNEDHKDLVHKVLPLFYALLESRQKTTPSSYQGTRDIPLDDMFELSVSADRIKAFLSIKKTEKRFLELSHVKAFLEKKDISYGIKMDRDIESWLFEARSGNEPFVIAEGRSHKCLKAAEIIYHFPVDYLHAGKVNEDGSIDFLDRGDIPHVEEGTLLAEKINPEYGPPGMDVFGKQILMDRPDDLIFSTGPGSRLAEDGTQIYAVASGQPHLDALGNISVYPEFQIKGDLGFETGHVHFDGNVIVNGMVKEGFKVKCASLTAKEIRGAEIDITGDLNVSLGIVDTELVKVKGSVQAKFVHNSKINAFGDLIVQKEIIDSKICLSGACINDGGLIINSTISAKLGISAGTIGNPKSKPSILTVGVDEQINLLVNEIDSKIHMNKTAIQKFETEILQLEEEDRTLHGIISKYAYVQDRAQLEMKVIKEKMNALKTSGRTTADEELLTAVRKIKNDMDTAGKEINKGFDRQDAIVREIAEKQALMKKCETHNLELSDEKKRLLVFSLRKTALPELKVAKKIEPGTRVMAAHSSLILHQPYSRCSIREVAETTDGRTFSGSHDMQIGNY